MTTLATPPHAETTVTPADLRLAAGQFATGVTIVTVVGPQGPRGMTANSFTSVSLDPPLVLVSIDLRRNTHALLEQAERFAINVLATDHILFSNRFASQKNDSKYEFTDLPHRLTVDGLPLLDGALAQFVCRRWAVYPGGDHKLFVGLVEEVHATSGAPLLYFAGQYHALGPALG